MLAKGALEINETRLHKDLFKGYNKHAHPRLPGTGPVTVTFDFQLIRILDVVRLYNLYLNMSVSILVEWRVFHAICIICTTDVYQEYAQRSMRRVIEIRGVTVVEGKAQA